jgi:hypothetical protein
MLPGRSTGRDASSRKQTIESSTQARKGYCERHLVTNGAHHRHDAERARWSSKKDSHEAEFERMSEEELIKAIEERANKLGIKINLRYDFGSGRSDDAQ